MTGQADAGFAFSSEVGYLVVQCHAAQRAFMAFTIVPKPVISLWKSKNCR
ncbi:MAG: hypothetical protein Q7U05_05420 [Polaromonas sp.]|nr:hypothetical protein [Polaromonas sp.]